MTNLRQVAYCGLYCGLCAHCNRVPKQARELYDTLRKDSVDDWGPYTPGFQDFWRFLSNLAESESRCSCREETCGPPFCTIRKCAPQKGVDVCPFCDEYPCKKIQDVAESYVMLLADGKRMKAIGLEKWIKEQEKRRATGFAYTDIRCKPHDVLDT